MTSIETSYYCGFLGCNNHSALVLLHRQLSWSLIYLSPLVFGILILFKPSTYGKLHQSNRSYFGPLVSAKWSWIIFESPNLLWILLGVMDQSIHRNNERSKEDHNVGWPLPAPNAVLLGAFFIHYLYRSIWYPCQISSHRKFPIGIMCFTLPYCIINGLYVPVL